MWVSPSIQSAEQVWLQEKWSKYVEEKMWSAESLFINRLGCYGRIQMRGQELLVLNGDFFCPAHSCPDKDVDAAYIGHV